MNIYHIHQDVNDGCDTFSDAVVCAKDEEDAKRIHPYLKIFPDIWYDEEKKVWMRKYSGGDSKGEPYVFEKYGNTWTTNMPNIKVVLIGTAKKGIKRGVICASFHAG